MGKPWPYTTVEQLNTAGYTFVRVTSEMGKAGILAKNGSKYSLKDI